MRKNLNKYFTVHSLVALKNKSYSIWIANIDNTIEKLDLAKQIYPESDFLIEFHNYKKCMKIVIN